MNISENLKKLTATVPNDVTLVAVSKTKPLEDLMLAYHAGQRVFGENKIQEMAAKWEAMPKDVEWHMIGHVQTNKVKYMAAFVTLIHTVDSLKLLAEIHKQALKYHRVIPCLLQIKIADEESKFGLTESDAISLLNDPTTKALTHVKIVGLMGMATFTEKEAQLVREFSHLKRFYDLHKDTYDFQILSMGMSGDYKIAMQQGSNMIRVGSAIFGDRNYSQ